MKQKLFMIGNWMAATTFIYFLVHEYGLWAALLGFGLTLCGAAYMYEASFQLYLSQEKVISALKYKLHEEEVYDDVPNCNDHE